MAGLKRSEVARRIPPEVRDRASKGGLPAGQVDWYAGREVDLSGESQFDDTPGPLRSDVAIARSAHHGADSAGTTSTTLVKALGALRHTFAWLQHRSNRIAR